MCINFLPYVCVSHVHDIMVNVNVTFSTEFFCREFFNANWFNQNQG